MLLCKICKILDFRTLFQQYLDKDGSDHSLLLPHTIFSIRRGSQGGCELCSFTWTAFMAARIEERKLLYYAGPQGDVTDEELSSRYKALFWAASSGGWVRIWSPERDGDRVQNDVAAFVAFPIADSALQDNTELTALLSREIVADSGSDRALAGTAEWLRECHDEHEHCSWTKLLPTVLPTRVIDVGSASESPHLHITTGSEVGTWTALSYCWGGASEFILTAESRSKLEKGVPLMEFPATLRDAITATRVLGIRYIWIDALCILQDSIEDWEIEAPRMGQIYMNAEVVIAATGSDNVTAGIFKTRPRPQHLDVPWTSIHPDNDTNQRFVRIHVMADDTLSAGRLEESRWSTRGWTMQEDFMATRLLIFTDKQTHWECLATKIDESGFRSTPGYIFAEGRDYSSRYITRLVSTQMTGKPFDMTATNPDNLLNDPKLYMMWYIILKAYSKRNLAKTSDRLPALSGLAICFQGILKDEYYAGLWKNDMISGLTWSHGHWGYAVNKPSREVGGPSWSWTSLEAKLDDFISCSRPASDDEVPQTLTRIIDIQVELVSSSPFGAVKSGRLTIEAPFTSWDPEDTSEDRSDLQKIIAERVADPKYAVNAEFTLRHKPHTNESFIALHLFTTQDRKTQILLLESLPQVGGSETLLYVRVGKLMIRPRWIFNEYDKMDPSEMSYISTVEHEAYGECNPTTLPSKYPRLLVPVMKETETKDPLPLGRFVVI